MLGLTLVALGISACGLTSAQKEAIGQFSETSATLGDAVTGQLTGARNDIIDMNTSIMANNRFMMQGKMGNKIDGVLSTEHIVVRLQAAKFLKNYVELLTDLVQESRQKENEAASQKLVIRFPAERFHGARASRPLLRPRRPRSK